MAGCGVSRSISAFSGIGPALELLVEDIDSLPFTNTESIKIVNESPRSLCRARRVSNEIVRPITPRAAPIPLQCIVPSPPERLSALTLDLTVFDPDFDEGHRQA